MTFYLFGADFLRGSWAQTTLLCLALATVFAGSMLAYKEKVFKKRLAYSTVSQVSYVLFGLFLLNSVGFTGALLQVVFHALVKNLLFLAAGAVIYKTGKTDVRELVGIANKCRLCLVLCVWRSVAHWHSADCGLCEQMVSGPGRHC